MGFFGRCTLQPDRRRGAGRVSTVFTFLLAAAFPILLHAQYPDNQPPADQPYPSQAYPPADSYPAQQQYPQQQNPYEGQAAYPQQQYPYAGQSSPYPQQQDYASQLPPQNGAPLSPQQLDDLVAPIALYPDPLIGEVLAACTYPMEVAQAQQWVRDHNGWQPAALLDGAKQQNWDASVQGLVAFPSVLAQLTQNMSWATALGNAFLAQQGDVMQAIQRMRQEAQARGTLRSNPEETVSDQYQDGEPYVAIEPASPDVMYVPEYNPAYVWGTPAWGYYPALYYPAGAGLFWGRGINLSFCFGGLGWLGWGGWGWRPNWFAHSLWVDGAFFHRYGFHDYGFRGAGGYGRSVWMHSPEHRWGVPYGNRAVAARFGQSGYGGYRANTYSRGTYGGYNRGNYAASYGHENYAGYNRGNYGGYGRSNFAQTSHYGNTGFEQHAFAGNRGGFSGYHAAAMPRVETNHFSSGGSSHSYGGYHSSGAVHGGGGGGSHFGSGGGHSGGGSHGGGGGHSGGRR